jgi:hypothetical protein
VIFLTQKECTQYKFSNIPPINLSNHSISPDLAPDSELAEKKPANEPPEEKSKKQPIKMANTMKNEVANKKMKNTIQFAISAFQSSIVQH